LFFHFTHPFPKKAEQTKGSSFGSSAILSLIYKRPYPPQYFVAIYQYAPLQELPEQLPAQSMLPLKLVEESIVKFKFAVVLLQEERYGKIDPK
jgi:hypothetical protein